MRTFIAIELPPEIRDYILHRQRQLRAALAPSGLTTCFRWTAVQNIHLTLRFLGDTDRAQQGRITAGLTEAAQDWRRFDLCMGGVGCFPNFRQPNVLWLGVNGDIDALQDMQRTVEQLARAAGFEAESRAFSPHLTIARAQRERTRADLQRAGEMLQGLAEQSLSDAGDGSPAPCFPVTEVVHMHSDLRPAGPVYASLSIHRLGI